MSRVSLESMNGATYSPDELAGRKDTQSQASSSPAGPLPEGGRNNGLFRVARALRARGAEYEEILSNLMRANIARCEPPLDDEEVQAIASSASRYESDVDACGVVDRPAVYVSGRLGKMTDAAKDVLLAHTHLFQRSGLIEIRAVPSSLSEAGVEIAPVGRNRLRDILARHVRFVKRRDKEELVEVMPPMPVVDSIVAQTGDGFRPLRGIISAPTITGEGAVIDRDGYDAASGLYLRSVREHPIVPSSPSRDDARAALATLKIPFVDFPWLSDSDLSAAIALAMTIATAGTLPGNRPLFAIRGTTPGEGKTLATSVISLIATGRAAAQMAPPESDAESQKRLLGLAMMGAGAVFIDNVDGTFGFPAIASAVTTETLQGRVLGTNNVRSVPNLMTLVVTGNNLHLKADMGRRVVPIDLESGVEHPEDRTGFAIENLAQHASREHPRYLGALLTVLRAWFLARSEVTPQLTPLGSFEEWTWNIAEALVWLGEADPLEGRQRIRDVADDELTALRAIYDLWFARFGAEPKTLRDVEISSSFNDELREALAEITSCGRFDTREIGVAFRKANRRVVGGFRLESVGTRRGATLWRVTPVAR